VEVRTARPGDVAAYVALGKVAQAWPRSRGLGQYVPAAHDGYAGMIRAEVGAGSLHCVWSAG
jgi:hypothetical protein